MLHQQPHPLRVRISAAAGDAVQVDAAGHTGTRNVRAVPSPELDHYHYFPNIGESHRQSIPLL